MSVPQKITSTSTSRAAAGWERNPYLRAAVERAAAERARVPRYATNRPPEAVAAHTYLIDRARAAGVPKTLLSGLTVERMLLLTGASSTSIPFEGPNGRMYIPGSAADYARVLGSTLGYRQKQIRRRSRLISTLTTAASIATVATGLAGLANAFTAGASAAGSAAAKFAADVVTLIPRRRTS